MPEMAASQVQYFLPFLKYASKEWPHGEGSGRVAHAPIFEQ